MSDDQEQKKPNTNTIENLEEASPDMDATGSSVQDELARRRRM